MINERSTAFRHEKAFTIKNRPGAQTKGRTSKPKKKWQKNTQKRKFNSSLPRNQHSGVNFNKELPFDRLGIWCTRETRSRHVMQLKSADIAHAETFCAVEFSRYRPQWREYTVRQSALLPLHWSCAGIIKHRFYIGLRSS